MKSDDLITVDPEILGGTPVFKGTRVPVKPCSITCLMLRFVADENFNGAIVRGMLRQKPTLELVRVQDVGLSGIRTCLPGPRANSGSS